MSHQEAMFLNKVEYLMKSYLKAIFLVVSCKYFSKYSNGHSFIDRSSYKASIH